MKKNIIHMNQNHNAEGMAQAIQCYLESTESMTTQILSMPDGGFVVQGKTGNRLRTLVGMKKAITAKITPINDNTVELEVGEGQWIDKAVTSVVSWFVLWPLAVTAIIGSVQQAKLPANILRAAEQYAL